jgi:hypothetical protein
MNETPVAPPSFQYSTTYDTCDPLKEGFKLGCTSAAFLALVYAISIPVLFVLIQPFFTFMNVRDIESLSRDIANLYSGSLVFVIIVYGIGVGPAVIIGGFSGFIIGYIFEFLIETRLSFIRAVWYGFCISLCMLALRLWLGWEFRNAPPFINDMKDFVLWVVWIIPNIIAFFGFWWVTYKVNTKMPTT